MKVLSGIGSLSYNIGTLFSRKFKVCYLYSTYEAQVLNLLIVQFPSFALKSSQNERDNIFSLFVYKVTKF